MLKLRPLFSGSNGNCTLVSTEKSRILIDCGVSAVRIERALSSVGENPRDICAILVTHEHSDHSHGAGVMARRYKIPVYATVGTQKCLKMGNVDTSLVHEIDTGTVFDINDMSILPFDIPHDARQPCGYRVTDHSKSVVVATDMGHMDDRLFSYLKGCEIVLIESNYDEQMLRNGSYPHHLKQRILGKYGHLSNDIAAAVCSRLVGLGTHGIMLGHLSGHNNDPQTAFDTTCAALSRAGVVVARDVNVCALPRSVVCQEMIA